MFFSVIVTTQKFKEIGNVMVLGIFSVPIGEQKMIRFGVTRNGELVLNVSH